MTGCEEDPKINYEIEVKTWQLRALREFQWMLQARLKGDENGVRNHEHNMNKAIDAYHNIGRAAIINQLVAT